jgi:hypothetical protein
VSAPGGATLYGSYYDQEFGEFYGVYDTTVLPVEPAPGTTGSLQFETNALALTGSATGYVSTMQTPVAIPIATLNADPRCLTSCPTADQWYPTPTSGSFTSAWMLTTSLASGTLYFPELYSNVSGLFDGAAIDAVVWPGGTVVPATYTAGTWNVTTSEARTPASEQTGALVPNGPEMFRALR